MKLRLLLFLMAFCTMLSSFNAFAVNVKGYGYEFDEFGEKFFFNSETLFDENGLRKSETRVYIDEFETVVGKSVSTFDGRGQEVLRTYYRPTIEDGWEENGLVIIYNYDTQGHKVEETMLVDNEISYSYLWSFSSEDKNDQLNSMWFWNGTLSRYEDFMVKGGLYTYSEFDEKGREVTRYENSYLNSAYGFVSRVRTHIQYSEESGYPVDYTTYTCGFMEEEYSPYEKESVLYNPDGSIQKEIYYMYDKIEQDFKQSYTQEYEYDGLGNELVSLKLVYDNGIEENDSKRENTYDAKGNNTEWKYYKWIGNDWVLDDWIQYEYSENGLCLSFRDYDRKNEEMVVSLEYEYSYDEQGRMVSSYSTSDGNPYISEQYSYDGNRMTCLQYRYLSIEKSLYTKTVREVDAFGRETLYEFYFMNMDTPEEILARTYDEEGNLISLDNTFLAMGKKGRSLSNVLYDDEGRVTDRGYYYGSDGAALSGSQRETMEYDADGRISKKTSYEWNATFSRWDETEEVVYGKTVTKTDVPEINLLVRGGVGRIEVVGFSEKPMSVVGCDGMQVYNGTATSIGATPSLYIVRIGDMVTKVIVR